MAHLCSAHLRFILPIVCALAVPADGFTCQFDLTGPKAERVFFALGMLFESPGRRAGAGTSQAGTSQVELFYCNEQDKVPLFKRVVTGIAKEQGLPGDLREETKQGCLTILHSPSLAPRLDACYTRGVSSLALAHFARPGVQVASNLTLAPKDLVRRRALAYVAGVWARYRRDRAIVLTAGTGKADLVATLLKALGCANVRVETSVGYSPGANTVHFEPTAEVSEWLGRTW